MIVQRTFSPVDDSLIDERPQATDAQIATTLARAVGAQPSWAARPLEARRALCEAWVDAVLANADAIAREITLQMGRPIAHSPGELRGFAERARYMLSIAESALRPIEPEGKAGFERFIQRVPLGVVLTIAPWNYPLLTAVNSIVPALVAGNTVVLKHSDQTPLVAERLAEAARIAELPPGVFSVVHCSHEQVARMIEATEIGFVAFTGSVAGGRAIQQAVSRRFIGAGLELGGKDPAYVRADADMDHAVANLVDGAFFNAGQSCCGIERIYVEQTRFDEFVQRFVALTREYQLGDPRLPTTTLGPLVRARSAAFVREQIAAALAAGATAHIDSTLFAADAIGTPYLAPQVLTGVDHGMSVMREESFGPVVGIQAVKDDAEAIALMNDSEYGLTASVWTQDRDAAVTIGALVNTGTFFMNRCDALDPALAWTGVKNSGRGCTLSVVGYEALTRPKSFHLRREL